jgi:hypothetical protein
MTPTRNAVTMAALFAAVWLGPTTGESAAAIIDDRFETYAVNNPAALSPPWTVTGNASATAANQSPITPVPSDDQGIQMKDNSTTNNPILAQSFAAVSASTLYIQFDFRSVIQSENSGFQLRSGSTIGVNLHMFAFNADVPQYNNGSGFTNLGVTLTDSAWYRYTLTIAPASSVTDSWSLRIQSLATPATDVTFSGLTFQNQLTSIDTIRFHFNTVVTNQFGEYSLDNLLVTTDASELNFAVIPSPAALPAGLAMLLAFVSRRR